jgi:hypothetical protein
MASPESVIFSEWSKSFYESFDIFYVLPSFGVNLPQPQRVISIEKNQIIIHLHYYFSLLPVVQNCAAIIMIDAYVIYSQVTTWEDNIALQI